MAVEPRRSEREVISDCVHCGFCLPTCPTYLLWGEEMDSPRGRIVLMDTVLDGEMSPEIATHLDRCLGCMACVTACPSGVRYDGLIEAARPRVERARSRREHLMRWLMLQAFTRPGWLRAGAVPLALRLHKPFARLRGRFGSSARLAPPVTPSKLFRRLPSVTEARGVRRGRVGLLQGCVQRVFFPEVNRATAAVLAAEGFEVFAPHEVRCCGALMLHEGLDSGALALAKKMIEAFEGCDLVVVNAAGCGSAMKDYGDLLAGEPAWAERARAFSDKVRDVSEVLTEFEPVAPRRPVEARVAYHDACHLAHAQRLRAQPRAMLSAIPGIELLEPVEWEICCGSAGLYNILQPEAGAELGSRKASNLAALEPQLVAAGNPGCALQIGTHLRGMGVRVPVVHPIEIVAASIEGRSL